MTASTGKLLLGVLASIAEFETDIRKGRQRELIEKAKVDGVYKGRKGIEMEEALRAYFFEAGYFVVRGRSISN